MDILTHDPEVVRRQHLNHLHMLKAMNTNQFSKSNIITKKHFERDDVAQDMRQAFLKDMIEM